MAACERRPLNCQCAIAQVVQADEVPAVAERETATSSGLRPSCWERE